MKKLTLLLLTVLLCGSLFAQETEAGDAIIGIYKAHHKGSDYKVRITKKQDGTYRAQVIYLSDVVDERTGEKRKDVKNPNKALRDVPCDRIVLMDGIQYIPEKQQWGNTKIYDPQSGIRVNAYMRLSDRVLSVRGQVLGIGQTIYWTKQ